MEDSLQVLLMYGERRQLIELNSRSLGDDKSAIEEQARRVFELHHDRIYPQVFMEDFDEWVEIKGTFVAQPFEAKN